MNIYFLHFILILFGYLVGSFPSGVIISKTFFGFDIRTKGSGNMGSTNVIRILGKKWGFLVQFLDLLKGYLPVFFCSYILIFFNFTILNQDSLIYYKLIIGVSAILGHVFSIFVGFKGGKGINTSVGMLLALDPIGILFTFLVFLIILLLSGYVSLGSILGSVFLSFSLYFRQNILGYNIVGYDILFTFSIFISILIIYTHRANIKRLFSNNESKFESLLLTNIIKKYYK